MKGENLMKKFKRFLCIPLLVLFTMTILTLPVAAAVKVLLPDGKPAASMTLQFECVVETNPPPSLFGPVNVTTDAQGIFAYPAELARTMVVKRESACSVVVYTTSPSQMMGSQPIISKDPHYNKPITIKMDLFKE